MAEFQTDMLCCTDTICDEVAAGLSRKDIALSYALAMRSAARGADKPDWSRINHAILARFKMSSLEWIKKRALDLLAGKAQP